LQLPGHNILLLFVLLLSCRNPQNHSELRSGERAEDSIEKRGAPIEGLQKILEEHLARFKKKFNGKDIGFGMYLKRTGNGPFRDIYVSSGFPGEYGDSIHFRGASTTKTFTAAAILRLHQQGKLNIDDLITDNMPGTNKPYIPGTDLYAIPYKNRITIRLLLQHRAGVFDVTNTDIPGSIHTPYAGARYFDYVKNKEGGLHTFTFPEMVGVVSKQHLSYFKPGSGFHYSNTGFNLLATIIERISGKRYDQFMQSEFLAPLQMHHTYFPYLGSDQQMPVPHVAGWLKVHNGLTEVTQDNVSFAVSEGNIITTPADLATWANALYGSNKILNPGLQLQMITGIKTGEEHVSYGLGCETNPADLGFGHDGARPAYMTVMRYHPPSQTSIVLFGNFLDFDDFLGQADDMNNLARYALQLIKNLK
jgi:D-alanyl-D-alanine carboxypeptidase